MVGSLGGASGAGVGSAGGIGGVGSAGGVGSEGAGGVQGVLLGAGAGASDVGVPGLSLLLSMNLSIY